MQKMAVFRASRCVLQSRRAGTSLRITWSVEERGRAAIQLQLGLPEIGEIVEVVRLDRAAGQDVDSRHEVRGWDGGPMAALEGADIGLRAAELAGQLVLGEFFLSPPESKPHEKASKSVVSALYCAGLYFLARHKEVAGNEYNQSPYNVVVMRPDNRLRELRRNAGLTQEALAERTGVSQSAISQLENGSVEMGIKWMRAFARALGCTVADLLVDEDNPDRLGEEERAWVQHYREADGSQRETLTRVAAAVLPYRPAPPDDQAAER